MNELRELARQALAVLDQQKAYFSTRSPAELERSKAMEKALRKRCEEILHGHKQPGLFGEEAERD